MAAFGGAPEKSEEETPKIEKSEAPEEDNEEDGGVEKNDDQTTGTFTALVHLEEQESSTGEEDEDVLYTQRAKLFFYGQAKSIINEWFPKTEVEIYYGEKVGETQLRFYQVIDDPFFDDSPEFSPLRLGESQDSDSN